MVLFEGFLQGMQFTVFRQTLNRRHLGSIGLKRQCGARLDRQAIHFDHTTPTLRGIAPHVRTCEPQKLSQSRHKQRIVMNLQFMCGVIHG
jgi:hypothetical protein